MRRRSCGRPEPTTRYGPDIANLTPGRPVRLLDIVPGRSGVVMARWLAVRDADLLSHIDTALLDLFRGYATALAAHLPTAVRVLPPSTS